MNEPMPAALAPPPEAVHDPRLRHRVFARALAGGAAWAEIFHELRVDASITLASGDRTSRSAGLAGGVGLRVVGPAGSCQAFSPLDDAASLLDLAGRAAAGYSAMAGGTHAPAPFSDAPPGAPAGTDWADALDLALLEDRARTALLAAEAVGTDGVRVRGTTWLRTVTVANSRGVLRSFTSPGTRVAVDAFARNGSDRRKGRSNHCAATPVGVLAAAQAAEVGERAAGQARRVLGTGTVAPAALPVVLAPKAAGLLVHELLGHPCEADMVAAGSSPVHTAAPGPVTDSCVSVRDGCSGADAWGAAPWDDEGTPNPQTLVIDRGHGHHVLSDRRHADLTEGQASSGNGRRQSYAHPVLPRTSLTRLAPGGTDPQAMVAGLATGLWVLAAEGGAVNARTGMLTIDVKEARVIRSGTPAELVSGVAITADAREVLRGIRAVGDDPLLCPMICGKHGQWIPAAAESPSVLVERMQTVGG
ncbi:TldD/PmbA family protein [Kitasatospora atroaurantiaca]|uniref:Microcin-processing peptidase 2 n=1 Tax=Kitasatospora atroaurantiaca TaxID=285545 RepID=A0A561EIY2_9ACTN|nr:TldD/PmbA family protein [Kitasatospora atroaurantiaca]TWE15543.1 microcin-processing peptidase 2 [Kitasatospora atroaurantiaca]